MNKFILISYIPDFLFWFFITTLRNKTNKDIIFLRQNYILHCNGWQLGHFLSYFIKGLYFQENYFLQFFFIGLFFEFFEYFIQEKTNIKFVDSSIIKDPIINTLGYSLAITVTNIYLTFF